VNSTVDGAESSKAEASRGICADVLETIGRTESVRLRRVVPSSDAPIVCKRSATVYIGGPS
jgi:hypothetical protein